MFDDIAPAVEMVDTRRWDTIQRLAEEKLAIGYYLSGHPFEGYAPEVRGFVKTQLNRLGSSKELQTLTGVVLEIRVKQTQRGRMAFVKLDDATGQVEVSVFSELFDASRNKIKEDALLVIEAKVSYDDYTGGNRIVADKVFDLAEARSRFAKKLALKMNGQADSQKLKSLLSPYVAEGCPVALNYRNSNAECEIELGAAWRVTLRKELLDQLKVWLGDQAVKIQY
jgi:DNA polymerase-3 subunit alpha